MYVLGDGDDDDGTVTAVIDNTIMGQVDTDVSDLVANLINAGSATVSGGRNLIRTRTAVDSLTRTLTADPLLGVLADNGGPTFTHGASTPGARPLTRGTTPRRSA